MIYTIISVIPTAPKLPEEPVTLRHNEKQQLLKQQQNEGRAKTLEWLQDRYPYNSKVNSKVNDPRLSLPNEPRPIGFTSQFLNGRQSDPTDKHQVGFVLNNNQDNNDPFEELHKMYLQKQLKMHQSQGLPFMIHNGKIILAQGDMIERYVNEMKPHKESDNEEDEEFLDTTASMPSTRKNSLASTTGAKSAKSDANAACVVS